MITSQPLKVDRLNWLYFDFDSYFATIEQQLNQDLRGKPIAIVPIDSDATCAIAASYEAKAFGIKTGTKIYQAKKLCPELICIQARPSMYVEYHHLLVAEISKYMYVDYIFSIDEGACRLTGKQHKEAEALSLAKKIKAGIAKNVGDYITCSIGIAPNRYLAKIATSIVKPNGLTVISPDRIAQQLSARKLQDLPGVGRSVLTRLCKNNITTIEHLFALDAGQLQAVWGSIWGKKCWYLLRGLDAEPEAVKKSTIGQSKVLAPDQQEKQLARNVALDLLLRAAYRLRAKELYTRRVSLVLTTTPGLVYKTSIKIEGANDSMLLVQALLKNWDSLIQQHRIKRLKKISLSLNEIALESKQLSFEALEQKPSRNKLSKVLDQVHDKFGKQAISIGLLRKKQPTDAPIAFGHIPERRTKKGGRHPLPPKEGSGCQVKRYDQRQSMD